MPVINSALGGNRTSERSDEEYLVLDYADWERVVEEIENLATIYGKSSFYGDTCHDSLGWCLSGEEFYSMKGIGIGPKLVELRNAVKSEHHGIKLQVYKFKL